MRTPTLLAISLTVLLIATGCIEANRVVTNTQGPVSPGENKLHKVSWQSDLYEPQRSGGRHAYITDCFNQAIEGQPLPTPASPARYCWRRPAPSDVAPTSLRS